MGNCIELRYFIRDDGVTEQAFLKAYDSEEGLQLSTEFVRNGDGGHVFLTLDDGGRL